MGLTRGCSSEWLTRSPSWSFMSRCHQLCGQLWSVFIRLMFLYITVCHSVLTCWHCCKTAASATFSGSCPWSWLCLLRSHGKEPLLFCQTYDCSLAQYSAALIVLPCSVALLLVYLSLFAFLGLLYFTTHRWLLPKFVSC